MNNSQNSSNHLLPLREEHVDGLLFISRIREGLRNIDPERLRKYIRWYWKEHIRGHFYHEEKILLPYLDNNIPFAHQLCDDHAYIRDLVIALDREADTHMMQLFCDLLDAHINFEEKKVFVYLENNLSKEQLEEIRIKLLGCPLEPCSWSDAFWISSTQQCDAPGTRY